MGGGAGKGNREPGYIEKGARGFAAGSENGIRERETDGDVVHIYGRQDDDSSG